MKRMAEKEDMIATLFFTYDKNMPERLTEYSIWFSEKDGSAEIFHREKNALGTLDKKMAKPLENS
ncbi:hypothetical protein ACFRCQ_14690 [Cytobacillus firmus]|uniref:hypothetical protein n=1 Tax=Cytobacillus firmus TaxID=1399 RepID=UPI0036751388